MDPQSDNSTAVATETTDVKTYTQAEVDALLAKAQAGDANLEPAYEEGPHLADPEIRRLKLAQMIAHGWTGVEEHLTADMKAIFAEKGDS